MIQIKQHARALFAAALLIAAAAPQASAQINGVNFQATTKFRLLNTGSYVSSFTLGGMTLTGGSFNVTTDNFGYAAIGGGNNFGTAAVNNSSFTYSGNSIQMQVTFTSPSGVLTQIWRANLNGTVSAGTGGFGMSWVLSSNNPGSWTTPYGTGTFATTVNNIATTAPDGGQAISGEINAVDFEYIEQPTPEPASMVLLATGLLGVIGAARRRNRKS